MTSNQTVRNTLVMSSPVGKLTLVASSKGLVAIDVRNNAKQVLTAKMPLLRRFCLKPKSNSSSILQASAHHLMSLLILLARSFKYRRGAHCVVFRLGKQFRTVNKRPISRSPKRFAQLALPTARTQFRSSCRVTGLWQATVLSVDIRLIKDEKQLLALEGVSEAE